MNRKSPKVEIIENATLADMAKGVAKAWKDALEGKPVKLKRRMYYEGEAPNKDQK